MKGRLTRTRQTLSPMEDVKEAYLSILRKVHNGDMDKERYTPSQHGLKAARINHYLKVHFPGIDTSDQKTLKTLRILHQEGKIDKR